MVHIRRGFFLIIVLVLVLAACQKVQEDKIPPIIKLLGRNPDTVLVGCNYSDEGAVASDDKDAQATLSILKSGEVDTSVPGTYLIDYSVFDSDSNMALEQRMVFVKSLPTDYFEGSYYVTDTLLSVLPRIVSNYPVEIYQPVQNQNMYRIHNFNNFGEGFRVLIQPDSTGIFQINYDKNDTVISGDGWVRCGLNGLRMTYNIELPDEYQTYRATYKK